MNLIFIINGEEVPLRGRKVQALAKWLGKVLTASNNLGRSPEEWLMTRQAGALTLRRDQSPIEAGLKDGDRIYLSLSVGISGADYYVTVCAACQTASCWHGEFMCEKSLMADIKQVKASVLRGKALEHPDNYSQANLMRVCGSVEGVSHGR